MTLGDLFFWAAAIFVGWKIGEQLALWRIARKHKERSHHD